MPVQSIDRAISIIKLLYSENDKEHWAISDIADRTHLPVSTVHRILNSLMEHGLVTQIPETKHYTIGPMWMEVGLRQLEKVDYRSVAREVMKRLAYEVEESVYLNIPNGTHSIIIERIDSPLKIRVIDNLGEQIPLSIGAANKTILANMKTNEVEHIVDQLLSSIPEQKQRLFDQLTVIRREGYAVSYGEKTEGTASIAAPIIGFNHKVVGAISIGLISERINEERLAFLVDQVINAANEISIKIGGTGKE
ncbi:IclR family transcriptional regulator [Bacillus cytotoxicus]|uniref:IclR family transcriptional regulator n=1 Tax=Bacillus cereus group sp. BfR-BA-01492 TaxID=2920361 RepID=UPI001F5A9E6F|nr:IclR family transcriptional regulator [Bacillus cereus group sp. BfR-BA-01492]EMA6343625.1 IclR family transcriptional regulator [Bacillus cytotoxicus]